MLVVWSVFQTAFKSESPVLVGGCGQQIAPGPVQKMIRTKYLSFSLLKWLKSDSYYILKINSQEYFPRKVIDLLSLTSDFGRFF